MANLHRIVCCKIHPCIGIARVGNSLDEYFVGPEVSGRPPDEFSISLATPGQTSERGTPVYKDPKGRVKRQVARFRVFGYDRNGNVVAELDSRTAEVNWRVHVANRKAAWYQFENALDLGAAARPTRLRNASVHGEARGRLVIDPGSRSITNTPNQFGPRYRFTGKFMDKDIYLGELRTDDKGHLLVFGGMGKSGSTGPKKSKEFRAPIDFENNDGWYDDIADGPVRATVQIDQDTFEAVPAMVVVTPPNYAPGLYGVVTMYDVVVDLFRREFKYNDPDHAKSPEVEFWRDIYPILDRLVAGQWVNLGIFLAFGHGSPADFTEPALLGKLANRARRFNSLRRRIFRCFRDPSKRNAEPARWPPFYGDVLWYESMTDGRTGLSLTLTQWDGLRKWSEGDFATGKRPAPPHPIENLPVAKRPHALDRANLEQCLGGPFHPGIELPWSLRLKQMWVEPFRLRVLEEEDALRDSRRVMLRPKEALKANGPFAASGPGTLTRVLGVPWQISVAVCDAGYESGTYLPLPSFWAARVPNHVLDARAYRKMIDTRLPIPERQKHFAHRQPWLRFFWSNHDQRFNALAWPMYRQRINATLKNWHKVGIVTEHRGPEDHRKTGLPARVWAENLVDPIFTSDDPTFNLIGATDSLQLTGRGSRVPLGPRQQRTRPAFHSALRPLMT